MAEEATSIIIDDQSITQISGTPSDVYVTMQLYMQDQFKQLKVP